MAKTFETIIAEERGRLSKAREDAYAERQAAQDKLDSIERELAAINAYEQVKAGKALHATERKPRAASGTRAPREGSRKQEVLDLVNAHPDGLLSKQVIEKLGAKGDKAKTGGINNALNALKHSGSIQQPDGRGGM
jgi:hypothetical protein